MAEELRAELERIIRSILQRTPAKELGFYLHGSQWSGSAGPANDVDVLGLVADELPDDEFGALRALEREVIDSSAYPLDLKIHRLEAFGRDQYVDLQHASEFLGGVDLRDRLPERTFDDACHEQIAMACQVLTGGTVSEHSGWRRSAKDIGCLASAFLAARYGYSATGAHDAATRLMELEPDFGPAVHAHITMQLEDDSLFTKLADRTREALLKPAVELGPRCRATIDAANLGQRES